MNRVAVTSLRALTCRCGLDFSSFESLLVCKVKKHAVCGTVCIPSTSINIDKEAAAVYKVHQLEGKCIQYICLLTRLRADSHKGYEAWFWSKWKVCRNSLNFKHCFKKCFFQQLGNFSRGKQLIQTWNHYRHREWNSRRFPHEIVIRAVNG